MSAARGKPQDTISVDGGAYVRDALTCDHMLRDDFGERYQDECSLEQPRVREYEVRLVQRHVTVGEQVDVDRPRTPALFARAVAAKRTLDCERTLKQGAGRQRGLDRNRAIDEWRLICDAPRRRAVVGGAGDQLHVRAVSEAVHRLVQCRANVADIAAEADERLRHLSAPSRLRQ